MREKELTWEEESRVANRAGVGPGEATGRKTTQNPVGFEWAYSATNGHFFRYLCLPLPAHLLFPLSAGVVCFIYVGAYLFAVGPMADY